MALSCKTPEEGQKELKLAAIFGIPFILLAILFGLLAAAVVAVLFWRLVTKEAVVGSMIAGFVSGISWYHFGGWLPNEFYLNVHPVWVGMSANIIFVVGITLIQQARVLKFDLNVQSLGKVSATVTIGALLLIIAGLFFKPLYASGLIGMVIFMALISLFIATMIFVPDVKTAEATAVEVRELSL